MQTLLGVFHSADHGRAAGRQFTDAGYEVKLIDNSNLAADVARSQSEQTAEGNAASTASGATIGGIVGGGIGAVPGALLGGVVGDWLASQRAEEYERDVVAGGVMLVIRAAELAPAAQAESMLYQLGADHVENGEVPRA